MKQYAGQTASVVGTGPSLLKLTVKDFGEGPVLVLNDALLVIRGLQLRNPVYSLQKDGCLVKPEPPEILILSRAQSGRCFETYQPRHVLSVRQMGLKTHSMSAAWAVAIANSFGCTKVRMLAMDSVRGDFGRVVEGQVMADKGRGYLYAARTAAALAKQLRLSIEWC